MSVKQKIKVFTGSGTFDIQKEMLKDSKDLLDNVEVTTIAQECVKLKQREDELIELEEQVKNKKEQIDEISSRIIPELLAEQGLSAIKLAVSAGSKIYANKQRAKVAMSDAQLLHAERQARGEEAYQGKLLEARQNDYKDEFVLVILSAPIIVLAWGVFSDDPGALEKVKIFFEHFAALPTWFSTLWILVVGSIFGIKGTQIFKNGGKK